MHNVLLSMQRNLNLLTRLQDLIDCDIHENILITFAIFQDLARDFLERHILKKSADLGDNDDFDCINNENRLREYEFMILLELYLLQFGKQDCNINETDVSGKMYFLHFSTDDIYRFVN